jgi:hypothetical protein
MDHQVGSQDGLSGLDSGSEDETEYDVEQDLYEEIKGWVEDMNGKRAVGYDGESYFLMMNGVSTASHDLRVGVGGMKEILQYMVDRGLQVGAANLVAAVLKSEMGKLHRPEILWHLHMCHEWIEGIESGALSGSFGRWLRTRADEMLTRARK